jgi:carotenoid 1,2-hydratase
MTKPFPNFDVPVPHDGYVWWYVDGISDDGEHAVTIIAFIGSVFSSYYAAARRRGSADPLNYCAINVALYSKRGKRWAMTERGENDVTRDATSFVVGPSDLTWDGDALTIRIDEVSVPIPRKIRGTIRITPHALANHEVMLNETGQHRWRGIAPFARIETAFSQPDLRWQGEGYLDSNAGDAPLEDGFSHWTWSRAELNGGTAVLYDAARRDGSHFSRGFLFDRQGKVEEFNSPPTCKLPTTGWHISRETRADIGSSASVLRTLEDTPFYARSLVSTQLLGAPVTAVHESLNLNRFASRWVQTLLPFRMPRRAK